MHACFMVLSCLAALIRLVSWTQVQNHFCPLRKSISCVSFVAFKKPSSSPESPFQDLSLLSRQLPCRARCVTLGFWASEGRRASASATCWFPSHFPGSMQPTTPKCVGHQAILMGDWPLQAPPSCLLLLYAISLCTYLLLNCEIWPHDLNEKPKFNTYTLIFIYWNR